MHSRLLFVLTITLGLSPLSVFAAPSTTLDQEYDQVRRIALRDPKVKTAFENANQRLEAKIVEIDPALRGYAKGRSTVTPATSSTATQSAPVKKSFVKPSKSATPTAHGSTHVIAGGDTLSTIATRYKVTVPDLKAANPTIDEKKLQVGDKLTIPSHHQSHAAEPAPVKEKSAWERLKGSF